MLASGTFALGSILYLIKSGTSYGLPICNPCVLPYYGGNTWTLFELFIAQWLGLALSIFSTTSLCCALPHFAVKFVGYWSL